MSAAPETSRVWSCGTLRDGIDHLVQEANEIDEEEKALEDLIKDYAVDKSFHKHGDRNGLLNIIDQ